jgi:Domain of Unknown Function (DUF1080)
VRNRSWVAMFVTVPVAVAMMTGISPASPRSGSVLFHEDWRASALRTSAWVDNSTVGRWRVQYSGYGRIGMAWDSGVPVLSQVPMAVTTANPEDTHASLVTTTSTFGDIDLNVAMRTVRQVRQAPPNPWETAWVVWNHRDDAHFYSLVLKPNGWEVGKEDPAYPGMQRYLRTGSAPTFPIGRWNTVRVRQIGAAISVWVDGRLLTRFTDRQRPYTVGAIGLYNEDAHVHFGKLVVRRP